MFAPRWLFFYPGLALHLCRNGPVAPLLPGPVHVTPSLSLDVRTLLVAAISTLIGVQCISFAVVVRRYAASRGLLPASGVVERLLLPITLERVSFAALLVGVLGFGRNYLVRVTMGRCRIRATPIRADDPRSGCVDHCGGHRLATRVYGISFGHYRDEAMMDFWANVVSARLWLCSN